MYLDYQGLVELSRAYLMAAAKPPMISIKKKANTKSPIKAAK
jgi:hypothetical protein